MRSQRSPIWAKAEECKRLVGLRNRGFRNRQWIELREGELTTAFRAAVIMALFANIKKERAS